MKNQYLYCYLRANLSNSARAQVFGDAALRVRAILGKTQPERDNWLLFHDRQFISSGSLCLVILDSNNLAE